MKKYTFILLITIFLVLTLQVMASPYEAEDNKKSAHEAIQKFTNLSDLNLQSIGQLSTNSGDFEIFYSENSFYYVNTNLGIVEGVSYLESPDKSKNIQITQPNAEINARQYVIDHYDNFTGRNFKRIDAKLIDHDSGGKEYQFMWREFVESTGTPNFVRISVNPESGKIISYRAQQRDIEVSVLPKISKQEAVDTAIAFFPGLRIQRESIPASLSIEYIFPKTQVLTWVVTIKSNMVPLEYGQLMGFRIGGIIVIDAQTGKILQISEWR